MSKDKQQKEPRFYISDHGQRLLVFEYEFHISDRTNEDNTIVVKNGYSEKKDVEPYANEILNILNNGSI